MNGSIRIPILEQDYRPSFTPQNYVDAVQVSDPRGAALQGLGKSIGELGESIRENQKKESKPAEADHPAIAKQTDQNNKAFILDSFGQCSQAAAGLTQKVTGIGGPANASTDAALGSAAAGEPLSKFTLDPMAIAKLPSPVQAAVAGLMPGSGAGAAPGAGAGAAGPSDPANPASVANPAVDGITGAWIKGYDHLAERTILAAPTPEAADDLIKQCTTARQTGISRVLRFEADANLAKRQETVLRAAQNVGASRLRQDPAALPGVLAFFEAHKLDVGADKQKAFDAQWRGALVDAAVQGQMERDPQGLLLTLENRRSRLDLEGRRANPGSNAGTPAANEDAIDPLGAHLAEHPLASALTPEEVARYLPQVRAGVYTAASNQRAALVQQAQAATQSYLATGKADGAPDESAFITSFGLEEGRQRFAQLQQAREEGSLRRQLLALPDHELERMWGEGTPAGGAPSGPLHDLVDRDHPDTPRAPNPDMVNDLVDRQAGAPRAQAGPALLHDLVDRRAGVPSQPAGLLQRLITEQRRQRAADPIEAAQKAGGYGVQALNFAQGEIDNGNFAAALQDRAQAAPLIARDYRVPPALLSQAEVKQLGATLQGQKPEQQQALLKQLGEAAGDPGLMQATLKALSKQQPVIALAGWHQAKETATSDAMPETISAAIAGGGIAAEPIGVLPDGSRSAWGGGGKLNATDLLLRGAALLQPPANTPGVSNSPFPMPAQQALWHSFSRLTADDYADNPGTEGMQFDGARAIYAALKAEDGDKSTQIDHELMHAATFISRYGSATAREAGLDGSADAGSLVGQPATDGDMPADSSNPYLLKTMAMGAPGDMAGRAARAKSMFSTEAPEYKIGGGVPSGPKQPTPEGIIGSRPLSPIQQRDAANQSKGFILGLNKLFTALQVGDPTSYGQEDVNSQFDLKLEGRNQLREIGRTLAQDPMRGIAILQSAAEALLSRDGVPKQVPRDMTGKDMSEAVSQQGLRPREMWEMVNQLATLIHTGDPNSPDDAKQIGIGLQYLRSGENQNLGPALLLGLLAVNGTPEADIEKMLKASEQIDPKHNAYLWQGLTGQQMADVLGGMQGRLGGPKMNPPNVPKMPDGPGGSAGDAGARVRQIMTGLDEWANRNTPTSAGMEPAMAGSRVGTGTGGRVAPPEAKPAAMASSNSSGSKEGNGNQTPQGAAPAGSTDPLTKKEEEYRPAYFSKSDVSISLDPHTREGDVFVNFDGKKYLVGTTYINSEGSPEFMFDNRVTSSVGEKLKLKLDEGSLTEMALAETLSLYTKAHGKSPLALPGSLHYENLKNFREEFSKIKAADPSISNQQAGDLAIRKISFGKARMKLGYGNLTTTLHEFDQSGLPTAVHVNALPER